MRHYPESLRIRTWYVKALDATNFAELVLGTVRVERVGCQAIRALKEFEISSGYHEVNVLLFLANAAVAFNAVETSRRLNLEAYFATVTTANMSDGSHTT